MHSSERWDYLPSFPKIIRLSEIESHLRSDESEQYIEVVGRVIDTHNSGSALFLSLFPIDPVTARPIPLTVVIFNRFFESFPLEDYYYQRAIRIVGKITQYRGRPQILATTPRQITVLIDDFMPTLLSYESERLFEEAVNELQQNQSLLLRVHLLSDTPELLAVLEKKKELKITYDKTKNI